MPPRVLLMTPKAINRREKSAIKRNENIGRIWCGNTIVTGIICNTCKNTLPAMTMDEHLEGGSWTKCPEHKMSPPKRTYN